MRKVFHTAHHWVDQNVHRFIAVSQAISEAMTTRGEGGNGKKITVIPNGLTVEQEGLDSREKTRASLGISTTAPVIVCAARLEAEKDVQTLVEAMKIVSARTPDAVCIVAGEGSQRAAIEQQIAAADLGKQVRLLGFRKDVLALMNAGDLFVLPSRAEPFGLVLLEAMALGKPVIATRAGGPAEIVSDGETGLLVPPGNPQEMATAILSLLATPSDRGIKMGDAGKMRFHALFTTKRMAEATLEVYRQL